jgi:hypothetical protein
MRVGLLGGSVIKTRPIRQLIVQLFVLCFLSGTALLLMPSLTLAGTVNLKVSDGYDDAHENGNGSFGALSNYVIANSNTNPTATSYWCGGHRFQNVQIPRNATINSATLRLFVDDDAAYDSPNFMVYANGDDDIDAAGAAADFSTNADVIQRARTSAGVNVDHDDTGLYGTWYAIPEDLKDVIQEVVNRGTWNSGQPLVLLLIANADRIENFQSLSYNYGPAYAAELDIDYTPGWWDTNYQYRTQVTITNNWGATVHGEGTYSGTIVGLTHDTETLISSGKLRSDGKDWRIVYDNGETQTEIARKIEDGWNTGSTES